MEQNYQKATLGGGCFWGLESLIQEQPGVIDTEVGFSGGENTDPTWEYHPGHAEVVEITYDSEKISYKQLLDFFFRVHNPTTLNRQGPDIGTSYRSVVFYRTEEEKQIAADFIDIVNRSGRWADPVVTTLEPFVEFFLAEEFHQDFLKKYPHRYVCHAVYFDTYLSEE